MPASVCVCEQVICVRACVHVCESVCVCVCVATLHAQLLLFTTLMISMCNSSSLVSLHAVIISTSTYTFNKTLNSWPKKQ